MHLNMAMAIAHLRTKRSKMQVSRLDFLESIVGAQNHDLGTTVSAN